MIYPQNFEDLIGFAPLRTEMFQACKLEGTHELVSSFQMKTNILELREDLDTLDECYQIMNTRPSLFEWQDAVDMQNMLKHVHVEGYFLVEEEWIGLLANIKIYDSFAQALLNNEGLFPNFRRLFPKSAETKLLLNSILKVIDLKGFLRTDASANYQKISTEIHRIEKEVRQQTRSIFNEWKKLGYTAENEVTIREERLVIPILAEFKRKVKGFLKDISSTGKVLFMEPAAIVELNNRLKELLAERRREREKILKALTQELKPHVHVLNSWMLSIQKADFIQAKYQLCSKYEAQRPQEIGGNGLVLKTAVHPVLKKELAKQNAKVVPLDIDLSEKRVVVISGPNAGGKSVVLKTALLLQYWYQCGFFISAKPESQMGLFDYLGIDCGDGQSIVSGLSTFSAHLHHLKNITEKANAKALVGLDELGTGTDPRYGAPIAQVMLENLLEKGAWAIATTHFSQIREWGRTDPSVLQASMAYDALALKPLYQFVQGKPGSSFALELMRKTGFESSWIERINQLAGVDLGKTEDLMLEWERKNQYLEQLLLENEEKNRHLQLLMSEYQQLKQKIADKRQTALTQAKKEAETLLFEANKRIEQTIRIIQENKADKTKTLRARQDLDDFKKQVTKSSKENKTKEVVPKNPENSGPRKDPNWKPIPGEFVMNDSAEQVGEVIEIKKNKVLVVFGLIKMWIPLEELSPAVKTKNQKKSESKGFQWIERQSAFQGELDLRGVRTEEAKNKLLVFLDEAYALGHSRVKIIHGRGDGILRKMLRDFLKSLNYVKEYASEHSERGGDGCTIVVLN